jgi:hypothetical protein
MALINFTNIQDGTTAQASQVNNPLNTIYQEFNGNIDASNIKDASITPAKIDTTQRFSFNKSVSITSSATITPTPALCDIYTVTAQAEAATIAAPTGSVTDGQSLVLRIEDNGTARALTWNAIYRAIGVTLPTTTVINKLLYVGMKWNAVDSKWDVLGIAREA